ncbi:MAG: DUF4139 domain-containing protein [Bacteroidia bacterium]|nr:DUF4139 domain-containing protein [Bacteroidia bacterium]
MKKLICIAFFPLLGWAQTQNPELVVETQVKEVTLFLEGAEINQQKQINLNAGITQVVFTNLSSKLIPKSIQVNVGQGVDVLSISEKLNYLTPKAESARIRQLRDSLKAEELKIEANRAELIVYQEERELLKKNSSIGGHDKGVSVAELKLAADFYRSRLKEINTEVSKYDKKIAESESIANRINDQLQELNAGENKPVGEIMVLLQTETKTSTVIDLKYTVSDAGWAPFYDLKAEEVNKPITLVYKARAFNNTGIDWSNVKLKLTTSDPTRSASKPTVEPWYLNFGVYQGYDNNSGYSNNRMVEQTQASSANLENNYVVQQDKSVKEKIRANGNDNSDKKKAAKKIIYEEVQVSELSAEFDIKKTYTIPSDAKPYIVEVTTYSLDATFKHYSVPKVERDAFLLARIIGWEELDLIEGPANVYFGGSFVGQSYINPNSVTDTLDLSFGRDNKVVVSYTKIKDFNKEKVAGNNRKTLYSYEIVIKNNRKNAVNIDVEDQLPVSQNSEIIVEAIELSKGTENKGDGKIVWKYLIPAGETQKLIFTYSIKYPRNRTLSNKNKQVRLRAKF